MASSVSLMVQFLVEPPLAHVIVFILQRCIRSLRIHYVACSHGWSATAGHTPQDFSPDLTHWCGLSLSSSSHYAGNFLSWHSFYTMIQAAQGDSIQIQSFLFQGFYITKWSIIYQQTKAEECPLESWFNDEQAACLLNIRISPLSS